jgi:hypothetical protein
MALNLSSVHAKIERAYEHLETLDGEIESWVRRYPYGLRHEVRNEGREHVGFMQIYRQPDNVRFSLLSGECVHSLRSALDYLVRALAEYVLTPEALAQIEGKLAFPICDEPGYWEGAIRRGRLPDGLHDTVLAAIERRQPYNAADPADHPLAVLQALDDRDKHRLLHTFIAVVQPEELIFVPELPGPSEGAIHPPPYEHGSEVFKVRTTKPCPDLQVNCQLVVQIRIRESPWPEEVRETLPKLGQTIQRIVADIAEAHEAAHG